jgi:hypothetical protein
VLWHARGALHMIDYDDAKFALFFVEISFREPRQDPIEPPRGLEENASFILYTENHALSIGFDEKSRKIFAETAA